jgi:two-component system response regulator PilR (NtrC family)
MPRPVEVLVACLRAEDRQALARILERLGLKPILVSSVEKSRGILAERSVRLVFCEDELPDGSVARVLDEVHQSSLRVPVIVISRLENWDEYLRAMRMGAFDYITSPLRRSEVEQVIRRALDELPTPGTESDGDPALSSPEGLGETESSIEIEDEPATEGHEPPKKSRSRSRT